MYMCVRVWRRIQEVDLDVLDKIGSNKAAEEMRAELRRQEKNHEKELAKWDAKINKKTEELTELTAENTESLRRIAEIGEKKKSLESYLAGMSCKHKKGELCKIRFGNKHTYD